MLDLTKYEYPKITDLDLAFSTKKTDPVLLAEAIERGFFNGYTKYNNLFNELFFKGGKLNFKKDISEDFIKRVVPYLRSFMTSFEPKHEEKEAICSMLLSEIADVEDEKR